MDLMKYWLLETPTTCRWLSLRDWYLDNFALTITSWKISPTGIYDLTRKISMSSKTITIPMTGSRKRIIIDPQKTAVVVIDMQSKLSSSWEMSVLSALTVEDYFLHPSIIPTAVEGRAIVPALTDVIRRFRIAGIQILWTEVMLLQHPLAFV